MANILFVCTANICRSPTAELIARSRYGEAIDAFRSAGFLRAGNAVPDKLVSVLLDRGIDASAHRSSKVDAETLDASDLVLTMESSHIQEAAVIAPSTFPKMLPLKEAASLIRPGDAIVDVLERLNTDRDTTRYLGREFDVADPYGKNTKAYREAVDEIDELVSRVIGTLNR